MRNNKICLIEDEMAEKFPMKYNYNRAFKCKILKYNRAFKYKILK